MTWILLLRVQSSQIVLNRSDWGWPGVSSLDGPPGEARENLHHILILCKCSFIDFPPDIQWLIKFNISQTALSISKSAPPHITPASSDWHHWLTDAYGRKLGIILLLLSPALGINYLSFTVLLPKYFWKYLLSLHLYYDCSSSGLIIFCLIHLSDFLVHVSKSSTYENNLFL